MRLVWNTSCKLRMHAQAHAECASMLHMGSATHSQVVFRSSRDSVRGSPGLLLCFTWSGTSLSHRPDVAAGRDDLVCSVLLFINNKLFNLYICIQFVQEEGKKALMKMHSPIACAISFGCKLLL